MNRIKINIKDKNKYLIVFFTFAAILSARAYYYMPFIADDTYISLRYSQRLLDGYGLTWTSGIPVEGYSNLLWTLLMAGFGFIGVDMEFAARIVGYVLSIANIYLLINYVSNRYKRWEIISIVALTFYSFSGTIAVWSIGGLEQPLAAFLALLASIKYLDYRDFGNKGSLWVSSLALGLLCITRPDGVMLSVIIATYHLFYKRDELRLAFLEILKLAVFPLVLYFGQLLFRIYYYGELVPNTALVKVTPSLYHFWIGLKYTLRFFKTNISYTLLSFWLVYLMYKNRNKNLYFLMPIIGLWVLYLSFIGGDIFEGFRHQFYTAVFVMLLLADGMNEFLNKSYKFKRSRFLIYSIFSVIFISHIYQQFTNNNYRNVKNLVIAKHHETLAIGLKQAFEEEQPLIAVDAAGVIPYVTRFPSLDMLGLNDYYIARHKPENIGKGFIGHEFGDPKYTLNQNPDIIIMDWGLKRPEQYIDSMLFINPKFKRKYVYVGVSIEAEYGYKGYLWINKNSDKLGIEISKSTIEIPGYLFKSREDIFCKFDGSDLLLPVKKGQKVEFTLQKAIDVHSINLEPTIYDFKFKKNVNKKETSIEITNKGNEVQYLRNVVINY